MFITKHRTLLFPISFVLSLICQANVGFLIMALVIMYRHRRKSSDENQIAAAKLVYPWNSDLLQFPPVFDILVV